MRIGSSLSSAYHASLRSFQDATTRIGEVAEEVVNSPLSQEDGSLSDALSSISQLPQLKVQARASVFVMQTIDEMYQELGSLLRR